jgi:hypothetical protein
VSRLDLAPGLTCAACHKAFTRTLARRTRAGYIHAADCTSPTVLTEGRWVAHGGVSRWVAA